MSRWIAGSHILVVDDEPEINEILCDQLEDAGAKVQSASNVTEAKSLIDEESFDLIVSDVRMPGESGLELLKYTKPSATFRPVFLLMTGHSDINLDDAYLLGAWGIIGKPFSRSEFLNVIERSMLAHSPEPVARTTPRYSIHEKVFIQPSGSLQPQEKRLSDLGEGGMFVETSSGLPRLNETMGFRLMLPFADGHRAVNGTATVRWVRGAPSGESGKGYGLEFDSLDHRSLQCLHEFLDQRRG